MVNEVESIAEELKKYSFEIGPIRPPSESKSLLIRVTMNCPWSRCRFCYGSFYNREKFRIRNVGEVTRDIDVISKIVILISSLSKLLGGLDWVEEIINPIYLYGKSFFELNQNEFKNYICLSNVLMWMKSEMKTVFLQDADNMTVKTDDLVKIISYLKEKFPSIERISSYARSKSTAYRKLDDLITLRKAGLSRLHIGLETGDNELLTYVNKGVTAKEHIRAGKKVMEAGIELTEYVMPGLGGRKFWKQHALNTAKVLNAINPTYIRFRRFVPKPGTPMYKDWRTGKLKLLSSHELLIEIKLLIENLNVTSRVCFDHFINPAFKLNGKIIHLFSQSYEGYKFPEEKDKVLNLIKQGLKIDESLWITTEELVDKAII